MGVTWSNFSRYNVTITKGLTLDSHNVTRVTSHQDGILTDPPLQFDQKLI